MMIKKLYKYIKIYIYIYIPLKSQKYIVYNYVNFINIFYEKELLAFNYSKYMLL